MKDYLKIQNSTFVRDMKSKAILNTDENGLAAFTRTRDTILREKKINMETKAQLKKLEQDMCELKELIAELIAIKDNHGH